MTIVLGGEIFHEGTLRPLSDHLHARQAMKYTTLMFTAG
jgi:hypothetical protein